MDLKGPAARAAVLLRHGQPRDPDLLGQRTPGRFPRVASEE
ncbi:hypothetical protein BN2537_1105 [Streptomyces venezuelae]|nr:hypothetical protein BN2537_1105 [Streptomyces venezuelae]